MTTLSLRTSGTVNNFTRWSRYGLYMIGGAGVAALLAGAPVWLAAVSLIGAGLGLALLAAPLAGLVVLAFMLPLNGLVQLPLGIPGLGVADILIAVTGAVWLMKGVVVRRSRAAQDDVRSLIGFDVALMIFLWIGAASLTQARSWSEGFPEWIKWAEFGAVYLLASRLVDRRNVRWLLAALIAAGLGQAALGAYQFITQSGPEAFVLMGRFMRAYGTFRQPNPYAGYLGYLVPVAASLMLFAVGRWWRTRHWEQLAAVFILAGVSASLVAGIVLSWSRGAWFGLAAALIAVGATRTRKVAALTVIVLIVVLVVAGLFGTDWLPGSLASRVSDLGSYFAGPDAARTEIDDANFSVLERLAHWQAGWRMFEARPWLGVGIGNFGVAYADYALPHWYEPLGHAHNVFINFFAETGVLGGAAFLATWTAMALTAVRGIRGRGMTPALATGILGVWVYLTVHNQFDNLFVQHMQIQLAMLLGALVALQHKEHLVSRSISIS